MANLETIYIEIDGSAEKAKESVNALISSLAALKRAIEFSIEPIERLVQAFKEIGGGKSMQEIGSAAISAASGMTQYAQSMHNAATAIGEYNEAAKKRKKSGDEEFDIDEFRAQTQAIYERYHLSDMRAIDFNLGEMAELSKADTLRLRLGNILDNAFAEMSKDDPNNSKLTSYMSQMKTLTSQLDKLAEAQRKADEELKQTADEAEKGVPKVSGFSKALQQIGRIAKTLIIRTALRSLIKSFGEAWTAAYEYSKGMGGQFAESVEKARGAIATISTKIVTSFAPVLNALIPVIHVITNAINFLCDAFTKLMSLLGISSELFGASAEDINKYANSSKNGSKTTKNLLASFDQLNIIQSKSGSGGGGSANTSMSFFSDMISDELARLSLIIGESLLAVGLILAFTGHIGIGLGMVALGAATIVKTTIVEWGKLSDDVKNELSGIMIAAGLSLLAIGAIIAFTGANVPLGIALMIAGGLNIAGAVALNWNTISQKIHAAFDGVCKWLTDQWNAIETAITDAYEAVKQWWEDCKAKISAAWGIVSNWFVNSIWNPIKDAAVNAWDAVSKFWEDMKSAISAAWSVVSGWFEKTVWNPIKDAATNAWEAITVWWEDKKADISKAWTVVSGWFETTVWNPIQTAATSAWESVSTWWNENVKANVEKDGVWGGVEGFFKGVFVGADGNGGILGYTTKAFDAVNDWVKEQTGLDIKKAWEPVGTFFKGLWEGEDGEGGIKAAATSAWNSVSDWWSTNVSSKVEAEGAWGGVVGFFNGLFGSAEEGTGIIGLATKAWGSIESWWTENIYQNFSDAWSNVTSFFYTLFGDTEMAGSIASYANDAWNVITDWWDTNISGNISGAWDSVKDFFVTLFASSDTPGSIAHYATTAFSVVEQWWTTDILTPIKNAWDSVTSYFTTLFGDTEVAGSLASIAHDAWSSITEWWNTNIYENISKAWNGITEFFEGLWGTDAETGLSGLFNGLWNDICKLWGDIVGWVEGAWGSVATWFYNNVTVPVANFFIDCINSVIDALNWMIRQLNSLSVTIPDFGLGEIKIGFDIAEIAKLDRLVIQENADGAYGIPRGDLFIANEQGAELVGQIGGKSSVANQGQIVEGIQKGVRDANDEQNKLLRQQNDLLRGILEKSGNINISPSAEWGKFNQRSTALWNMATGR